MKNCTCSMIPMTEQYNSIQSSRSNFQKMNKGELRFITESFSIFSHKNPKFSEITEAIKMPLLGKKPKLKIEELRTNEFFLSIGYSNNEPTDHLSFRAQIRLTELKKNQR